MSPPDVELSSIYKRFGEVQALADFSVKINAGEFFALLGPTGCGKSTALSLIAGLIQPDAGEVRLLGQLVNDVPAYRRPTSMVFQHFALFPNMNVRDNIGYGLSVRRTPKAEISKRVDEMLQIVGLTGFGSRRIQGLSGGEQQRIALARALINKPRVLLLDEPLSAIDQALRSNLQVELRKLQQSLGITFVLVTHDQQEALAISDRLAVMAAGRVVQVGVGSDVYARPRSSFVASFLGDASLIKVDELRRDGPTWIGRDGDGAIVIDGQATDDLSADSGRPLTICIRPEHLALGADARGMPNRRAVRIEEVVFRGQVRTLFLRSHSGQRYIATTLSRDQSEAAAGDFTEIGWDPEAATVLVEG
jgi:spermidine/putrescine transport system ATP-binding protein